MTASQTTAVTFVGHSTVLIEIGGKRFLTDPLLRDRFGPVRRTCPAPDMAALRQLDGVLISHLHHDHLDLPSLRLVPSGGLAILPAGAARLVRGTGFREVAEMEPGAELQVEGVCISAVPAAHSGARWPFGPWVKPMGFLLSAGGISVYFAGDTGLVSSMEELRGRVTVALLPVWGWGPHLRGGHLDPRAAAAAVQLIRPEVAIPIHWGTYWPRGLGRYRKSRLTSPGAEFVHAVREAALATRVILLAPGERWEAAEP